MTTGRKVILLVTGCVMLMASACDSEGSPKKGETASSAALVKPTKQDCGGIFDKMAMLEIREKKELRRVYYPGRNTVNGSFGAVARHDMQAKMVTLKPDPEGCVFADKNKKDLIRLVENWGPETFPAAETRRGRETYFTKEHSAAGSEKLQLLVDCRRPDLARKAKLKKPLAMRVTFTDSVGLSDRTRAALLMNGAKILVDVVKCEKKVTFPGPESVAFKSRS